MSKSIEEGNVDTAIELDSHADSPLVGNGATIIEKTGRTVSVSGFTDRLGKAIRIQVANACYVYGDDKDGKVYIMMIRNALHILEMEACLIPPIMMQLAGLTVDECPKFLSASLSIANHSIYFNDEQIWIPLKLDGVISYIPCRSLHAS